MIEGDTKDERSAEAGPSTDTGRPLRRNAARAFGQKEPTAGGGTENLDSEESVSEPDVGYGHQAHRPDPAARYAFGQSGGRPLPADRKRRWSVTG